jgi:hypothetical protein
VIKQTSKVLEAFDHDQVGLSSKMGSGLMIRDVLQKGPRHVAARDEIATPDSIYAFPQTMKLEDCGKALRLHGPTGLIQTATSKSTIAQIYF